MPELNAEITVQISDAAEAVRVQQMMSHCRDHWLLFAAKNSQRGNSIRLGGMLGAVYEMTGIMGRLFKLCLEGEFDPMDEEQVKDLLNSFEDMHNYTVIAEMMYQEGNFKGKWF